MATTISIPPGIITFGPNTNCDLDTCPAEWSIIGYPPSMAANCLFVALFGLSFLIQMGQGAYFRTWGFAVTIGLGCIDEVIGYAGRIMLNNDPFSYAATVMEIVCITTAPVFYCAAIYVLLTQTINFVDPSLSRFDPRLFYWVFIPCDIVSLILQAVGGALSAMGSTEHDVNVGVDISLAGLVFQVFTLCIFVILFVDYIFRAWRSPSWAVQGRPLKIFLAFLTLAVVFIFIRCSYRIKELRLGYFSDFFRDETLFIALESSMMAAASFCLNAAQPGYGFKARPATEKV